MQFTDYLHEHTGATPEQIDDLRLKAQAEGRNLPDQAYLSGLVDERSLLGAIRLATEWPTVELVHRKIDVSVCQLLTGRQAWTLRLLPFSIDKSRRIISIACQNPGDSELQQTIKSLFPEYQVKLHYAVGPILEALIIEQYRSEPLLESSNVPEDQDTDALLLDNYQSKVAYLIGAQTVADKYLGQALAEDGYYVILADNWSELTEEISSNPPDLVLIREVSDSDSHSSFTGSIPSEIPASTVITRYRSVSELLNPSRDLIEHSNLAVTNLHLATEALAQTLDEELKVPIQIGVMTEKLCQQLRLGPHDHLMTVTAGYLQDIAALHFKGEGPADRQTAYFMLQGLIDESQVYPPAVLNVIRSMYCDLVQMKPSVATLAETRNGNILTAIDYYLRQFPDKNNMTPRRFDLIEQKIRDQIGRLLLPDVAEGLLSLLHSEVTHLSRGEATSRGLVLDDLGIIDKGLAKVITDANFGFSLTSSLEQFVSLYQKRSPELLIITSGSKAYEIESSLQQLISKGIVFDAVPSFLFHSSNEFDKLAKLAKFGISHSIYFDGDFEIFSFRLKQLANDKEKESRKRLQVLQEMGTHGSLVDMNVIDLLQSMGPSNKTLCINVSGKGHHLMMYLHQGQLVHASLDDLDGVEAVYEAIKWDSGIWSVDHITCEDIPTANIQQSIDSILMQGCYLLDEMNRSQPVNSVEQ